jgi:hypothetical protein
MSNPSTSGSNGRRSLRQRYADARIGTMFTATVATLALSVIAVASVGVWGSSRQAAARNEVAHLSQVDNGGSIPVTCS